MTLARVTRKQTASNTGGLVSFLTVARASANRMLDAPLGMVSTWADGQPLYSSSFGGADWHWQADFPAATATDNETTCRPTSWIAGGLNGAAVRNLTGNRTAVTQATWRVDSTAADNEGTGSSLDPVKTDVEIGRRFGPGTTELTVPVAITYAQSSATITNFDVKGMGGSLTLTGTMTVNKSGLVISAVTTQVRTAGAEARWGITAPTLGAADVGKLVRITASATPANVGAYAYVLRDNGANNVTVSPFGTFAVSDSAPFVQVTPAVNDTVEIITPSTLTVGLVRGAIGNQTGTLASPTRNCVVFDSLTVEGNGTSFQGRLESNGLAFFYARCIGSNATYSGNGSSIGFHRICGGGQVNPVCRYGSVTQFRQTGVVSSIAIIGPVFVAFLTDTYFENCGVIAQQGANVSSTGSAIFNRTTANTALVVSTGAFWRQTGAVPDWGTGNANHGTVVNSCGFYVYATKPTVNGTLGAGREVQLGGVDLLYGAVPAVTAANNASLVLSA